MNRTILALPLAALLLAACDGGSRAPTVSTLGAINGTVQGAPSGATTIKLLTFETSPESASNPALASAQISASGGFTLSLPSAATIAPYLSATSGSDAGVTNDGTCSGSISNSDPTSQAYSFSYLSVNGAPFTTTTVASSSSTSATATGKGWIYVNKPTTLSGKVNCTSTSGGVTDNSSFSVSAPLLQGWNVINISATVVASSNTYNTTLTAGIGSDGPTTWKAATATTQSVKSQALRSQNLDPSGLIQSAFSNYLKF